MAKRFTDTELWDKDWFMNLRPKLKCLVKLVRDKCDMAGVWDPNWTLANKYVGDRVTEKELLAIDGGGQFIKIENGKIFCKGFIEFQYGSELSEKSPVHRKVLSILSKNKVDYKHPTEYPINRVKEEEEDKDKVEDKEKEKDGTEEIIYPFTGIEFKLAWELWLKYKKQQFDFVYQPIGLQGALKNLSELSHGSEQTAIKIIIQSIQNGWRGFFQLKQNGKYATNLTIEQVAEKFWGGAQA